MFVKMRTENQSYTEKGGDAIMKAEPDERYVIGGNMVMKKEEIIWYVLWMDTSAREHIT